MQVGKGGVNPHLTKADWATEDSEWKECDQMGKFVSGGPRDAHTGCSNSPGFGSGMTWNPCNEKIYTITDRGPNQNCGDIDDDYKAGQVPHRSPGVSSGKGFQYKEWATGRGTKSDFVKYDDDNEIVEPEQYVQPSVLWTSRVRGDV